jgi:hypothetical protein
MYVDRFVDTYEQYLPENFSKIRLKTVSNQTVNILLSNLKWTQMFQK